MKSTLVIAFAALLLAGCNDMAPAPQAAAPQADTPQADMPQADTADATPQTFQMPGGEGCAGDIARYRAIQANDLAKGNVAKSVYNQIKKEIAEADTECQDGHDAQARATIFASRKRHGYPTNL